VNEPTLSDPRLLGRARPQSAYPATRCGLISGAMPRRCAHAPAPSRLAINFGIDPA